MGIKVRIEVGPTSLISKAAYRPEDFSLVCLPPTEFKERFYVMADTLTLVFDSQGGVFIGFDSYTNKEKWKPTDDLAPAAIDMGSLVATVPKDDDRIDLGMTPFYEFSESTRCLRILIRKDENIKHYIVGPNLMSGINAEGELSELIVSELQEEL